MSITSAYFRNILLPNTKAVDVCQALCQWHIGRGYQQAFGRRLFDFRDIHRGEERAFVLSNKKWCVVLHSSDSENGSEPGGAFVQFPAVIQLWADENAWGYSLQEHGNRTAAYCSKKLTDRPDDPEARRPSDLRRLVAACGIPQALNRLRRLERSHFLFVQKACAEFSDALEVPVAVSKFYDADQVNAGMAEAREACGWSCQMLAFTQIPGAPTNPVLKPWFETLTAEQRADGMRQVSIRKRIGPGRFLLLLVNGFFFGLWLMGSFFVSLFIWVLTIIPGLRKMLLGKSTRFCDEFWKKLEPTEPKRIKIHGELATNTRHGCSITVPTPATILPTFPGRKPTPWDQPVFHIKLGALSMSCVAYPSGEKLRITGGEILEERSFSVESGSITFVCRRFGGKYQHYDYRWRLHAPKADYCFTCVTETEMTLVQLQTMENIVRSLKFDGGGG
jgi:hypothetical protein